MASLENIKKISQIIHPQIRQKMNNFVKKNKKQKIIILDIPLIIENKINKKNDILIFVDAKKKEIDKRLKKRSNFNIKIIKRLKKFQLPLETKRKKSDFVIKNNFKNNSVKKSVKILKQKILLNA
jgi:dephospho-CoA kinase